MDVGLDVLKRAGLEAQYASHALDHGHALQIMAQTAELMAGLKTSRHVRRGGPAVTRGRSATIA